MQLFPLFWCKVEQCPHYFIFQEIHGLHTAPHPYILYLFVCILSEDEVFFYGNSTSISKPLNLSERHLVVTERRRSFSDKTRTGDPGYHGNQGKVCAILSSMICRAHGRAQKQKSHLWERISQMLSVAGEWSAFYHHKHCKQLVRRVANVLIFHHQGDSWGGMWSLLFASLFSSLCKN